MGKLIGQCPSCDSSEVQIVRMDCRSCGTKFEGAFDIPSLLRMPKEDLNFILDFIKCSGSLKEMASRQGVSYPTLRNRLNALIEAVERLDREPASDREEILELLETGKISAKEAAKLLRKL